MVGVGRGSYLVDKAHVEAVGVVGTQVEGRIGQGQRGICDNVKPVSDVKDKDVVADKVTAFKLTGYVRPCDGYVTCRYRRHL